MSFFEILIILLFIVLPLLQQVLGQGKGQEDGEAPEHERDEADPRRRPERSRPPIARAPAPVPRTDPRGIEGWSVDWGEWPAQREEELPVEGTLEEIGVEAPPPERPRERDVPQVVSLEPLRVDRDAEHERFHARKGPVLRPVKERPPRIATLLRGREGLRRAVLVSEVIGLPTAFRYMTPPPDRE